MMPQTISPETDPCQLADRWIIDERLARKLVAMTRDLPFFVRIISGYRTEAEQDELRRQGRPTAPNDKSTHLSCPATGADLQPSVAATHRVIADLGAAATRQGLRWGGGSPTDPDTGIPSDWPHVDLGPRSPDSSS